MGLQEFQEFVEEVRRKNPILEIVGIDADLEKCGTTHRCKSPFRTESKPSFHVYSQTESWYDFGTGDGGDVFSYICKSKNVDFRTAVDLLAERVGLCWEGNNVNDQEYQKKAENYIERLRVMNAQTEIASYYHRRISREATAHLVQHYGFDESTIEEFKIGWCDGTGYEYLKEQGLTQEQILETGLFLKGKNGKIYELMEDRITFPYWKHGRSPYMIGRRLDGVTPDVDYQKAKYKKTLVHSENHNYVSKTVQNDHFYCEDYVKDTIHRIIITEGVTDCISAIQFGYVAISPVTIRPRERDWERLVKLCKKSGHVVILNDEEEGSLDPRTGQTVQPGLEGAKTMAEYLFNQGFDVRIGRFPRLENQKKVDLNSFAKDNGPVELKKVVDSALRYPAFLIDQINPDLDPIELDTLLEPIYKIISGCKPVEQEHYITKISKKFNVSKKTISEKTKSEEKNNKRREKEEEKDQQARERGRVFESHKHYYFVQIGDLTETISSFTLRANEILNAEDKQYISVDITDVNGTVIKGHVFEKSSFLCKRNFIESLPSMTLQWMGNDDNVQYLLNLLCKEKMQSKNCTTMLGLYEHGNITRWVSPNQVIDENGIMQDADVKYLNTGASLANRLHYTKLGDEETKKLAAKVLPKIFELNEIEVILPTIGWFTSCIMAPRIRKIIGHFPILWLHGTPGCGKTTILRDVLWPLVGVVRNRDPFSATDTDFTQIKTLSSSTSIPIIMDEYKPKFMGPKKVAAVHRMTQRIYGGEIEQRGRSDQSVNVYRLISPLCIAGEAMPEEHAILERIIPVEPNKNSITKERQNVLGEILRSGHERLAVSLIQFVLRHDPDAACIRAKKILDTILKIANVKEIPIRCADNLMVMLLGGSIFIDWAESLGVRLKGIDLVRVIKILISSIVQGEGGSVKEMFDCYLESLSTYAHMGCLIADKHYAYVKRKGDPPRQLDPEEEDPGILYIHPKACYEIYLAERKKTNQEDETNGFKALKKNAEEKMARGSYITKIDHVVRLGGTPVRCWGIDPLLVPKSIYFDKFPVESIRTQGGWHRSGDDKYNYD